ncbi:hypothetical protein ACWF94_24915 [Streptomyces sp. NPDC055078]
MGAHLHAVPDPEPDEAPGPGDWPVPLVVAPRPPADDETLADTRQFEDAPADEEEQDPDDERRGLLAELQPYYDVRPLAELGPIAVEVSKMAGPPLIRGIARVLRALVQIAAWYGRGIGVLLVLLAGWLSGKYGKRGSLGPRFAGVAFVLYAAVKLSQKYEHAWLFVVIALVVTAALAASGHIEIPVSKPAKKGDDEKKTEEEGGVKKGGTKKKPAAPEEKEEGPEEIPEVSKEAAPEAPRKSLLARLLGRRATPAEESPADPEKADSEDPEEDPEEGEEEAQAAPSHEDVIRALHYLYRGGSGVLNTALAQHLQLPHTRALKEVLTEVGITPRPGVRTPAGNGPGVHRDDFPPLPFSQKDPQGSGVAAGQTANVNANNAESGPEGLGVRGNVWTAEEVAQGYRWLQDPTKPCAWKIEKHDES